MRKPFAALLLAVTVFSSGCANYGDTGMGVTVVTGTSPTARPVTTSSPEPAATTTARAGDVTEEEAPPPVVTTVARSVDASRYVTEAGSAFTLYRFVSPTRNLSCGLSFHDSWRDVGCQSLDVPRPAEQEEYGGHCQSAGVLVTASGAEHECFHTTYFIGPPTTQVLEYGDTITVADLSCTSRRTGMTCSYGSHGFTLSREEVAIF